jgi:hypothetical protein
MSIYQIMAAADGWIEAHEVKDDRKLSETEADEIWAWMQTKDPVPLTARKGNGDGRGRGKTQTAPGR